MPEVSDQTRRTVSRLIWPPSSPTSHCSTSASVNGGTSMRSTTSSFHSSSHGDCDTADDRAVATSCTSRCCTIHASAWLLAGSSRCASSTRRITGPPRERARSDSARESTVREKLPSEVTAPSPSSGSRAPSGMPAGPMAPETVTTVGIGEVGVTDPQVGQRGGHQVRLADAGVADDEHAATRLDLGADPLGEGPDHQGPS